MVTWVPGKIDCTASASTCAQSCRISSSAAGSSRVTISTFAFGRDRVGSPLRAPFTFMATAFLASDLEMPSATSVPVRPFL